jgi:hypothetical protein
MGSSNKHGRSSRDVSRSAGSSVPKRRAKSQRRRASRIRAAAAWRELFPVRKDRFIAWIEWLRYKKTLGPKTTYNQYMWYAEGMPRAKGAIEKDGFAVYIEWLQSQQPKRQSGEKTVSKNLMTKACRKFEWVGLPAPQISRELNHKQRVKARRTHA